MSPIVAAVQPSIQSKSQSPADKTNSRETDTESPLPSSPALPPTLKDVRAYEHDRQRAKKAAEQVKLKARKASSKQGGWTRAFYDTRKRGSSAGLPSQKDKLLRVEEIDCWERLADSRNDLRDVEIGERRGPGVLPEVKLADLVTSKKPRKAKGMCVIYLHSGSRPLSLYRWNLEGDFEVIPHIRSVIVLDDFAISQDLVIDEPWEHIYGESESEDDNTIASAPQTPPSYASILSTTK